ncbi:hypothetical protein MCOR25_001289 [Pyricularia grisea]|uniref:Auxin efflux carrier n=1 Tax=Pyricularia grisea TaxID=148305 RepID=A0A6P8BG09_PYRGI|nr:uncharacterized protein PgNI_00703 [Pyricularia grisea]KAI6381358.1 hypothetical protein MCOR25_001289 [Pyricularia grisea]TLD15660.1 hypothetical protein PgNI_00703 [Pyricularia grisea]
MSSSGLGPAFIGAIQASLSVLLTISYGVIASQFKLLNSDAGRQVSKACVKIFLPALLMTKLGAQLSIDVVGRYLPILLWSVVCNTLSICLGKLLEKTLPQSWEMPAWTTPAIAFNNTTSMPLLLIQALEKTGILSSILMPGGNDSLDDAVQRAKTYFLINTMVSNSITFALGPKLLSADAEDAPSGKSADEDSESDDEEDGNANEHTSLLPSPVMRRGRRASRKVESHLRAIYQSLPHPVQVVLHHIAPFANAPVFGAAAGFIIGLTPPLKTAFFADPFEGGFFSAWITTSLQNIGDLFASLQVIVVGVKLAEAMRKVKRGDDSDSDDDKSGAVPWRATTLVLLIRFFIWPAVAISAIWMLVKNTGVLSEDPILVFCMMLMPAGPPALKLMALAEVNDSSENQKLAVAKFLAFAYAVSPLMALTVVGSLKATENVA